MILQEKEREIMTFIDEGSSQTVADSKPVPEE